jgi:putative SOS response-associated peptidase YedK
MCGRFHVSTSAAQLAIAFGTRNALPNTRPRYNAAPTDPLPVVLIDRETKARHLDLLRWGLIPYWAKDVKIGYSTINAMAETIQTKPAFKEAFQSRRCIVPRRWFLRVAEARTEGEAAVPHRDEGPERLRVRGLVGSVERQGQW